LDFSQEEEKELSSFGLLTRKPILTVLNLGDDQKPIKIETDHAVVAIPGKLEMEIAQLNGEDAEMFMQEYGITEPALNRMIAISYDLLDQQSFFTVGEDEVRAWTTRKKATALESAGEIHSDIARGFIRAEVVAYKDLIELGSMAECKAKGKFRLEGKEYIVQDGDIVHIRSAI